MATTTMSRGVFIFVFVSVFLFLGGVAALAQTGSVRGVVKSADTQEALAGANVSILGTELGAATGEDGSYTISNVPAGTYRLQATFIGYDDRSTPITVTAGETATADFMLSESTIFGSEIVVTGSRRAEKLTDAPVSLSLVTAKELSKVPALTYAEALQKAKGVDTYRTGIDNVVLNARGFTTAYNYRFQILADGKKAHLPGAGLPAGRGYPVAREDIARMEAILGPSSALYGPNAHNGLLHIITKHPRDYPGTTLVAGGGENSILFGRVRHAQNFDKFAYKVNLAYFLGNDWVKNDTVGVDNTGKAYLENQDDDVKNFRTDASMYYLFSPEVEIVASAGYAKYNSITTSNIGRLQQVEQSYDFQQVRFNSPHFFAQVYRSGNDLGKTHSIENKVAALIAAANAGTPMTEDQAIDRVKFIDKGYRMNYEAQYNTTFYMGSSTLRFIAGIQHEDTRPNSEGTFLTEGRVNVDDPADDKLKLRQTGIYGQMETEFGERWKFVFAGRYDTHDNYESQFSPRAAVVYRIPGYGGLRASYNRAFQAPEIIQQELLTQFGLIGGQIPIILRGNGHGFTMSDGTRIEPLSPERNTTLEVGYKGILTKDIFLDVNAYWSRYTNFISPLTAITDPATGVAPVKMGDDDIAPFPSQFVLTYLNFGRVNMLGLDLGLNVQLSPRVSAWVNYSFIDPDKFDFSEEEEGRFQEIPFNTPKHKGVIGIGVDDLFAKGLYGSVSARFVDEYDFVAGSHRATKAGKGTGQFQFKDRGPLGGFTSVDLSFSYPITKSLQINLTATNILDSKLRESVGSPEIRRLILTELKYSIQ